MRYLFSLIALLIGLSSLHSAETTPNVIIVLSDDQGYGDLSCHGNPVLKTPNLDKLHSQSIRLTDFHVAPMCTPTRGQLLSGMDALHNKATSVCAGRSFLKPDITTLPEIFSRQGYKTAIFGKWHLGDSYPNLPQYKGFGESVIHLGWGITSMADTWLNDNFDGKFYHNGILEQFKGYCTDLFFNLGIQWMKQCQEKNQPFFLYLPTNAPHTPHWVDKKYSIPYLNKGPEKFFGMIANLDENMGRLDAFLTESNLAKNTIVIFMNDNGATAGEKIFNAGMRGKKTTYYEGGHRTICFIRWPNGNLGSPRDISYTSQIQDIYPTLLSLCKLSPTANAKFDGISLAPLLEDKSNTLPDRKLIVQYGQNPKKYESCVLWNQWRLVHGKELYDIHADPGQQKDIADVKTDIFNQMKDHYDKWWNNLEPSLNEFVPIIVGNEKQNPVTLSSADWSNVYCDNMGDLRTGKRINSFWNLLADMDGTYEVSLSRWPKEANAGLAEGVPSFKPFDGFIQAGNPLPVASVRLKIGKTDTTKMIQQSDKQVTFSIKLIKGTKYTMQSWMLDKDGKEISGAYFAFVHRRKD